MSSLASIVVSAAVMLSTASARGTEIVHVLAAGESLSGLATQYYGAAWKSVYIDTRNKIANDRDVTVGTRLVIPAAFTYRVRRGDSFADLARRFLGDRERYKALMQENGIKDASGLEVGSELLMPMHLRHTVEAGETLAKISQRYYRTTRRAGLLKDYNGTGDNLSPGKQLLIPIFDRATVDPAARRPGAKTNDKASAAADVAATPLTTSQAAKTAITTAVDEYLRGDFEPARARLEGVLSETGVAPADRATIVSYLGFCAVALDDRKAALDYFKKWRELDPKARLDPIVTSPKIVAIFEEVVEADGGGGAQ